MVGLKEFINTLLVYKFIIVARLINVWFNNIATSYFDSFIFLVLIVYTCTTVGDIIIKFWSLYSICVGRLRDFFAAMKEEPSVDGILFQAR